MPRQIPGDWCDVGIPDNAAIHETAYVATSQAFQDFRSRREVGLTAAEGAGIYYGCMFDVGPAGRVSLGRCCLLTAAVVYCDDSVTIGDHCLISWNVVIMDSYRTPIDPWQRRAALRALPTRADRRPETTATRPVRIGNNVWLGFDTVVLPGVTIGDGSIVGCRSVVAEDVPPYTLVAGNPARVIRQLDLMETPQPV
jgi:acetyltransferase-like isoleucine patch superfamily enzyme